MSPERKAGKKKLLEKKLMTSEQEVCNCTARKVDRETERNSEPISVVLVLRSESNGDRSPVRARKEFGVTGAFSFDVGQTLAVTWPRAPPLDPIRSDPIRSDRASSRFLCSQCVLSGH